MLPTHRYIIDTYQCVKKIDLSPLLGFVSGEVADHFKKSYFPTQYRLLALLSYESKKSILDLGGNIGATVALAHNTKGKVVTGNRTNTPLPENVVLGVGNWWDGLANTDFIYLSTIDAKTAEKVDTHLRKVSFCGIMVYDNIHANQEMEAWWLTLPFDCKYDLTIIGNYYGTGVLTYV